MLLKLTLHTEVLCPDIISESIVGLRMSPQQRPHQHRLSYTLAIGTAATPLSYFD